MKSNNNKKKQKQQQNQPSKETKKMAFNPKIEAGWFITNLDYRRIHLKTTNRTKSTPFWEQNSRAGC